MPSEGTITEHGIRWNLKVGIQYLEAWLGGNGCVPLYNLMEDAATAEISRAQVWQWLHHGARLDDGRLFTPALFAQFLAQEMDAIRDEVGAARFASGHFDKARDLFDEMIRKPVFTEFLTLPAYDLL
jgi:malate synthase A